jgi:hypothetical protein
VRQRERVRIAGPSILGAVPGYVAPPLPEAEGIAQEAA